MSICDPSIEVPRLMREVHFLKQQISTLKETVGNLEVTIKNILVAEGMRLKKEVSVDGRIAKLEETK